ncbi:SusC/RagA family TonB-linked outer membrane protein [Pedobacter xixiisoli]|uniref:TonB-linked outer membrane protein, SusC/RagA family n=2 Tax=Pedobacter xixiisoli TaxID=1476464 RepID=A0A286ACX0_9SPHI|nr:TonB-dependent receptor [Pedobacter xixiisoli]SOD19759.1 TonB-linked outer membrane protein, SusC/RagA family [Pedobacter xixiisoli]
MKHQYPSIIKNWVICLLILFSSSVMAQQSNLQISGTVTDKKGKFLSGVTVVATSEEDSKPITTVSDEKGFFNLKNLKNGTKYNLIFSYVGYKKYIHNNILAKSGESNSILIRLEDENEQLNEVLVVGYGTQNKKDITTSIASLKEADINNFPSVGLDKAMTGKMAGVQVLEQSGAPGSGIAIKVRGTSTITAGSSPLYVIDGIPMSDQDDNGTGKRVNSLNDLNLNDVASIEVLKDASAAAIYGSRGSNGVVMITTKRGNKGKAVFSYNGFAGFQEVSKKIEMLDAYGFAKLVYDARNNTYLDLLADQNKTGSVLDGNDVRRSKIGNNTAAFIPTDLLPYLNGEEGLVNTDWQDQVLRQAPIQSHSMSLRGGSENIKYYVSGNFADQRGTVIGSGFKKYNGRVNLDGTYDRFKFGTSINITNSIYNWVPTEGRFNDENIVSTALAMSPTMPVYNADGSYNFDQYSWGYSRAQAINPVALANLKSDKMNEIRLVGNVFAELKLAEGLHLKSSFGANIKDWQRSLFRPSTLPSDVTRTVPSIPTGTSRTKRNTNWVSENTVTYKKNIDGHSFNLLGGFTAQAEHSATNLISGTGYQNDLVQTLNYATTITDWSSIVQEWSLLSGLARLQYNYKGKYLFSAALRADGSSRFGTNTRWGYFPSASVGWNIDQESFFTKQKAVSSLKIRGSYGVTGNFGIGNYGHLSLIGRDNYIFGTGNGILAPGYVPTTAGNKDLKWETNAMFNLGADIGFFNDKLTLQVDAYNSNTSNLLLELPVPATSGFNTALRNVGKVNNKGLEFTLNTNHDLGKLRMNHSANISFNRNKVVDLGGLPEIISSSDNVIFFVTRVGQPIASYYTLETNGIYRSWDDVNNSLPKVPGARPGDYKFNDMDGNNVIDGNDKAVTGNYQPQFTYGYSVNLTHGMFDFGASLQGIYGNKVANIYKRYINNMEGNTNNMADAINRWQSEVDYGDGKTIRANRTAKGLNGQISTAHIEDGSYLRIRSITLGATLPKELLKSISVSKLRVYVALQNPFTFTKYSGYNPEVSSRDNPLTPGVDYGTYPIAKSFNIGFNLDF